MPTAFDALAAQNNAAVNGLYGELFELRPKVTPGDVNARAVDDPGRATLAFTGVYTAPGARAGMGVGRLDNIRPEKPGHASARPAVSAEAAAFPVRPRTGDVLARLSTGEAFVIAEIVPTGSVLVFQLNIARSA